MAFLFMDSFDHYATADISKKYTALVSGSPSIGAFGRNGTNGMRHNNSSAFASLPGGSKATLIAGFAFTTSALPAGDLALFIFDDGTNTHQFTLALSSTGKLRVFRGYTSGTLIATGATTLSTGTFYYLELKVTFSNTGSYELRINGTTELSNGSVDTTNTANNSADTIVLTSGGASATFDFDDFYVLDNTGTANNDFIGDMRVQCIFPDGAGGNTQWTPSAGSNYQNVDETAPNGDTDYNSDATIGDRDTYTLGALSPSTASIKALQIIPYVRKDDAGTRTVAPVYRIGGTNYDQASLPSLTTSYQYLPQISETSPATTVAWTLAEVNGAEAGLKVIA